MLSGQPPPNLPRSSGEGPLAHFFYPITGPAGAMLTTGLLRQGLIIGRVKHNRREGDMIHHPGPECRTEQISSIPANSCL